MLAIGVVLRSTLDRRAAAPWKTYTETRRGDYKNRSRLLATRSNCRRSDIPKRLSVPRLLREQALYMGRNENPFVDEM